MRYLLIILACGVLIGFNSRTLFAQEELNLEGPMPNDFHKHLMEGQKKIDDASKPQEFKDKDFSFENIKFKKVLKRFVEVTGTANNLSGKNFGAARFNIKIYNKKGGLLAARTFFVNEFLVNKKTAFNFYMPDFDYTKIKRYEFHFEEGSYF